MLSDFPEFHPVILGTTIFIFLIGFIYAYSVSFIFGIKKTVGIGFFVVVLANVFSLLFMSGYLLSARCHIADNHSCDLSFLLRVSTALAFLLIQMFINLIVGYLGVAIGIGMYFPSEWFLAKKHSRLAKLRVDAEELGQINAGKKVITTGSVDLSNMYDTKTSSHS